MPPPTLSPNPQPDPGVVFSPRFLRRFQRGVHTIVDAIRPTLGPTPRITASQRTLNANAPELLDSGGDIARRIIALPDPDENSGAMFTRGALWRLHERVGDGVATAAVIFESLFDLGLRYTAAGGNPVRLRACLHDGLHLILAALDAQTTPLAGRLALEGAARAVCYDDELAAALSEAFDLIGEYGVLELRAGRGRGIEMTTIEGSFWSGGVAAKGLLDDARRGRSELADAALLISDLDIQSVESLVPPLQAAAEAGVRHLAVIGRSFSEAALAVFHRSRLSGGLRLLPLKLPAGLPDEQITHLEDLAVLTGGTPRRQAAGDRLENTTAADLGRARRIWASEDYFGVVHGKGDALIRRRLIEKLGRALAASDKAGERKFILGRLGRLTGGAAILEIGGSAESEITARQELARRAAEALRQAIAGGTLPGGGAALLACRPALRPLLEDLDDPDRRAAGRMLQTALEAPLRTLAANAGVRPGEILARLEAGGPGSVYDLRGGRLLPAGQAEILDIAGVQKQAVASAVLSAGLALTVDVLVHRKNAPVMSTPD